MNFSNDMILLYGVLVFVLSLFFVLFIYPLLNKDKSNSIITSPKVRGRSKLIDIAMTGCIAYIDKQETFVDGSFELYLSNKNGTFKRHYHKGSVVVANAQQAMSDKDGIVYITVDSLGKAFDMEQTIRDLENERANAVKEVSELKVELRETKAAIGTEIEKNTKRLFEVKKQTQGEYQK